MKNGGLTILPSGAYQYSTNKAVYVAFLKSKKMGHDKLLCNLSITNKEHKNKRSRFPLDLFDDIQIQKKVESIEGNVGVKSEVLYQEINQFSLRLEDELNGADEKKNPDDYIEDSKSGLAFLKSKDLIKKIDAVLSIKVAGEAVNRLLMLLIAISYRSREPLHGITIAKSGTGKSFLIKEVTSLLPPEDLLSLLVLTKSSIPNMTNGELIGKCVIFEDMIHLSNDVLQHIREAQTSKVIGVSKYSHAEGRTVTMEIPTHISTLGAITTDAKIPIDNMNRSFLIDIDSSEQQTKEILNIQARIYSGEILEDDLKNKKSRIQDAIRLLKPIDVINPFASQLTVPSDCDDPRRLQTLFLGLINTITFLYQYQREKDEMGRVITTSEDVELAIELTYKMFITKSDSLPVITRNFFEELKAYLITQKEESEVITEVVFKRNEIVDNLKGSKTTIYDRFSELVKKDLIVSTGGNKRIGEKFRLAYDDEYQARKERIKEELYSFIRDNK